MALFSGPFINLLSKIGSSLGNNPTIYILIIEKIPFIFILCFQSRKFPVPDSFMSINSILTQFSQLWISKSYSCQPFFLFTHRLVYYCCLAYIADCHVLFVFQESHALPTELARLLFLFFRFQFESKNKCYSLCTCNQNAISYKVLKIKGDFFFFHLASTEIW